MAVYPPELERKVRARLSDFEFATRESGHGWLVHDVTTAFSTWLAKQEYRGAYYRDPDALAPALPQFLAALETDLDVTLSTGDASANTVVAVVGVGSLFPMIRVSELLQRITNRIEGRLLVLFPGSTCCSTHEMAGTTWPSQSPFLKELHDDPRP
jgi:hypothetical protein